MKTIKVEAAEITTQYTDMLQTMVQTHPAVSMVAAAALLVAVMYKLHATSFATPFLVITIVAAALVNVT